MAEIEITGATGNQVVLEKLRNLRARTKYGVQSALHKSGVDLLQAFNKQVLSKDKTGKIYIRKDRLGRRRRHKSSAGGESPANRTGFYRKASDFKVGTDELKFGNSAEYAGYLELGTSRMEKRPGLGNAVSASERNIMRNFEREIA